MDSSELKDSLTSSLFDHLEDQLTKGEISIAEVVEFSENVIKGSTNLKLREWGSTWRCPGINIFTDPEMFSIHVTVENESKSHSHSFNLSWKHEEWDQHAKTTELFDIALKAKLIELGGILP